MSGVRVSHRPPCLRATRAGLLRSNPLLLSPIPILSLHRALRSSVAIHAWEGSLSTPAFVNSPNEKGEVIRAGDTIPRSGEGRIWRISAVLSGLAGFPQWRGIACLTWIGRYRTSALNTTRRRAAAAPEGDPSGGVAQLVRAPACHAGGRGFEPRHSRHSFCRASDRSLRSAWNADWKPRWTFGFGWVSGLTARRGHGCVDPKGAPAGV